MDEHKTALESLATALNIYGQRGARIQPLVVWLAETYTADPAATIAAPEIAAGVAAGGDWEELIGTARPR